MRGPQKRRQQTATSSSRRPAKKRIPKPKIPWARARGTTVPQEIIDAQPPEYRDNPIWVRTARAPDGSNRGRSKVFKRRMEGCVDPVMPEGVQDNQAIDGGFERQDCRLMFMHRDAKQAREYEMQQRSEAHLAKKTQQGQSGGTRAVIEDEYTQIETDTMSADE